VRLPSLLGGSVVALLAAGALCVAAGTILGVMNFRDSGYPDSSNLIRIGELVHSGHLYPDIDRPPYLLTLYGPLTYLFLAVPYALAQAAGTDPQIPVRLAEVAAFVACLCLIFRISRQLHRSRPMAWLSVLFAVSTGAFASWTTQIRGDLPAVAVSLLTIYLVLRWSGRGQIVGGAICGGIAVLVKQTFWAASVAVVCWLIYRRRFRDAVLWVLCWALTIVCGYGMALWREPLVLQHFAAMRHPIIEYQGAVAILLDAVAQPIVPFAVFGGFVVLWKSPKTETLLLLIYCLMAWLVAILTSLQAGANFNYFWEPLLSSAVLAGPGLCELQRKASRIPLLGAAMLLILLYRAFLPMLAHDYVVLRISYRAAGSYRSRRAKWESFVKVVSGRRLLSTSPDVTIHSSIPEMPDPYLNSSLERRGAWSASPVVAAIDAGSYDAVIIGKGEADGPSDYRGMRLWNNDGIWRALRSEYTPACTFEEMEVWAPNRGSVEILPQLLSIGCVPLSAAGSH
jgi:hypothetical protein